MRPKQMEGYNNKFMDSRLNIVNMTLLPIFTYRLNVISTKILAVLFLGINKLTLKCPET